jgi:predicted 2-oxoglutarate/Fe(II)-dependent dioxygenase YbiX
MVTISKHVSPPERERRGLNDYACLRAGAAPKHAHLDWVRAAERLSDADCDELIALGRDSPLAPSTIVGEEQYAGHRKVLARRLEASPRSAWVFDLLCTVASEVTSSHFELALTSITRAPQYVEYEPGRGQFGWHNDYSHGLPDAPRKLTIIIQLSSSEAYQGGSLQTFGIEVEDLPRERGTIIAFPSLVYHQITPVTWGRRCALVAWIAGPRIR